METKPTTTNDTPNMVKQNQPRFIAPPVDVLENKEELIVYIDLPGVQKDAVSIHIDKDQLLIEARRAHEELGKPLMVEYRPLNFSRRFGIQQGTIEVDKVSADLQNGVLRLTLPKAARMKPRVIPVTSG